MKLKNCKLWSANYENCTLFKTENKIRLLDNAEKTLKEMSYFALSEYEELSPATV